MVVNEAYIDVPPRRVFDVLCDPQSYGDWVVGSRTIRDADPGFPQAGTRFHHQLGYLPFVLNDNTEVLEVEPPHRLVLLARAQIAGSARIDLRLEPDGGGTRVTMVETPVALRTRVLANPLVHPLLRLRNAESLRRLRRLAEGPS